MGAAINIIPAVFALLGAAGFTMINVGLSRAHASATLCATSIGVFAISILSYHFIGQSFFYGEAKNEFYGLALTVFASSIFLGALTERIRIWPCILFAALFSAIIFPLICGWAFDGWINQIGYVDDAGITVHIIAGSAALAGAYIMGPRTGRYAPDGRPIPFSGSNIPLATLGGFLVCIACAGMTVDQSYDGTYATFRNLLLGGAGGALAAMIFTTWRSNKPDTTILINGLLAGIVSVSGGGHLLWPIIAVIIGAVGGGLCAYIIPLLDKYKFDDPIGVTPVHLAGGIWGALAVALTGHVLGQLIGLVIITGLAVGLSAVAWYITRRAIGLRCSLRAERHGLDMEAVGLEAYPDFPIRTAGRPDITQIDRY
jgi:ammonium transporter, Amt family